MGRWLTWWADCSSTVLDGRNCRFHRLVQIAAYLHQWRIADTGTTEMLLVAQKSLLQLHDLATEACRALPT